MSDTQSIGFIFNLEQINKLILEKNRLELEVVRLRKENENLNNLLQEIPYSAITSILAIAK